MTDRTGIFAGDDPFAIAASWLATAEGLEPNDPNAVALATVDADGMPNVRIVLLKEIEAAAGAGSGDAGGAFLFYTNYASRKAREIEGAGRAALAFHWKSTRRQLRARGTVTREEGPKADAYFASRSAQSRLGAWASRQSQPIASRDELVAAVAAVEARQGPDPLRPAFWGGYRLVPTEIEFWADGPFRLHDRFRWSRDDARAPWSVARLSP